MTPPSKCLPPEEHSSESRILSQLQPWEIAFLLTFAAAIVVTMVWQSGKQYFSNDELCTSLLVTNPSLSEMLKTISKGGELNPPLFFILEWAAARLFGPGEIVLRAISGVSVAIGGWALFFAMRLLVGGRSAALAVALVLGLSREVFFQITNARYYGVLFLLVSIAIWLALRSGRQETSSPRNHIFVFLTHCALAYVHLFGLLFSGAIFLALLLSDALTGKRRLGIHASIVAAWCTFAAWVPFVAGQVKAAGAYTPPDYYTIGYIADQITLQTPFGLILVLLSVLAFVALIVREPCPAAREAQTLNCPSDWITLLAIGVLLIGVQFGTWILSFLRAGLYMPRYVFPSIAAWVLLLGLLSMAIFRLPGLRPAFRWQIPRFWWSISWFAVLLIGIGYQPMRAWKSPPLPNAPFVDADFGHPELPLVLENSWYFLPRAFYGQKRSYILVIDTNAAKADSDWYTSLMERFFKSWYPHYGRANIARWKDLPDQFLAVDDDRTKTLDWLFEQHPETQKHLLGTLKSDHEPFGDRRIYLVRKQ